MNRGPFEFKEYADHLGRHYKIYYRERVVGFIQLNSHYRPTEFSVWRRPADIKQPLTEAFVGSTLDEAMDFVLDSYGSKDKTSI